MKNLNIMGVHQFLGKEGHKKKMEMAWHVANSSALTSFSFYQDTGTPKYWISRDLKNPANLFKYNLNNTRNNMKSKIQIIIIIIMVELWNY